MCSLDLINKKDFILSQDKVARKILIAQTIVDPLESKLFAYN